MIVLAIDPGPIESAFVVYNSETHGLRAYGKLPNHRLLDELRQMSRDVSVVVIEKIESFGMAVGAEVFETVYWSGRFAEAAIERAMAHPGSGPFSVERIGRKAVKLHLCNSTRANDSNIRAALLDLFGGASAVGKKLTPGPLYGIKGDVWSALAVAVTYSQWTGD